MKNILVIDDEEIIREMIQTILEDEGYNVYLASDGSEGLKQCRSISDISLAITDIVMPEKEGLETIHELRKIVPDLKIMAVSGVGNKDTYLRMAKTLGADFILPKPFSAEELVASVEEVISD
ncbi:MAG: response regulator [Chitinispirillaceae bacterium]